ncbi:MAG TPA: glycosyltransferase [Spongiibacteraceae bacterium]|nr:glycosyltransferase [Spongiibacteraceae bacterium]
MNGSIKVLIIGYVWPEPRSSAAGSHMLQIIEQCTAQHWQITFASPSTPGQQRADLSALGVAEKTIALNCSSFDNWVCELQPDIVIFDRFMMEEQFGWRVAEQCPQALRVLESADLHCLRAARQRHLQQGLRTDAERYMQTVPSRSLAALYTDMAGQDIAQREIAAIFRCDLTLLLSDVEMELLIQHFRVPNYLLHYCPFLLDAPTIEQWPAFSEREHFISIGNFLHEPNWDAVLWLKQTLWPMIRARLPRAQLFVYGAYPSPKVSALHNPAQGFNVLGWVEDALAAMQRARICLAPLRFGAGIKGKLVDAMLSGTPSVTTSIGAESMTINAEQSTLWSGAIADDAQGMVDAAIRLHESASDWRVAQQSGLTILRQRFDKQRFGAALVERLQAGREQLEQNRRNNFVGAMLQHHMHKSTHYMARWIEAKNSIEANNAVQSTRSP